MSLSLDGTSPAEDASSPEGDAVINRRILLFPVEIHIFRTGCGISRGRCDASLKFMICDTVANLLFQNRSLEN
jgi:hypothetical protein